MAESPAVLPEAGKVRDPARILAKRSPSRMERTKPLAFDVHCMLEHRTAHHREPVRRAVLCRHRTRYYWVCRD